MVKGKYDELFQPITIGKVEIKNRIYMSPMCTGFGSADGYNTEQTKAWWAARAKGGVGMVYAGPVNVVELQEKHHCNKPLGLWKASHKVGNTEVAEVIHYFGAKAFLQMGSGAGRQGTSWKQEDPTLSLIAASPIPYHMPKHMVPEKAIKEYAANGLGFPMGRQLDGETPREATIEEIVSQEDGYAATAQMAKECGFDAVEIHHAHGYYGFSFLSPRSNQRTDMYGGSFENRTRFLRNSLRKVRAKVGDDFCVGIRMSIEERMPSGLTHEEVKKICLMAQEEGANFIHLSDGCYEAFKYLFPNEDGTMIEGAASIKKAVKIPVLIPSIHDPDMAEQAIKEGKTDMVGLGRGLIADPEWANKVARGEKPVRCLRCNIGCLRRLLEEGLPIRCVVNPEVGFEQYNPDYQAKRLKKDLWLVK